MLAAEAKVKRVLGHENQFLVPHYQRPYSWGEKQWQILWQDLQDLMGDPGAEPHFVGSIVTSPARSVPETIEKRLLIDGQQRLTTIMLLLCAIRDRARAAGDQDLIGRIGDLVTNRHERGTDHYKLLPTQAEDPSESDREAFTGLIDGSQPPVGKLGIAGAYRFFESRLRRVGEQDLLPLFRAITERLTLVSIVLDEKDNPHRIFESLNAKGQPLSQADLIRNFFFMRMHAEEHARVYRDMWRPMQHRLGEEALTDFVRHYLTRSGQVIRETDVYTALKEKVDTDAWTSPIEHLRELIRFAEYYQVLLQPEHAPSPGIRDRFERLNRLEVTVAYPFLLSVYADFDPTLNRQEAV